MADDIIFVNYKRTALERIKGLTREQKIEEFRYYVKLAGIINFDVDRVMLDQKAQGADDNALDEALMNIATITGNAFSQGPMSAREAQMSVAQHVATRRAWKLRDGFPFGPTPEGQVGKVPEEIVFGVDKDKK